MIRIGHSTDIHRLEKGETLILGGLNIPSHVRAIGHSDADCLVHSISEALLGSLALGDLGTHFSDQDPQYKDYDSKQILKKAYELVLEQGYRLVNLDAMIFLESPKLNSHILAMRSCIAGLLAVSIDQVSIKATTGEKVGIVGKEEAIVCETVLLIEKKAVYQPL